MSDHYKRDYRYGKPNPVTERHAIEALDKVKIRMIRSYPFYGSYLLSLPMVLTDQVERAGTDGQAFFFNPDGIVDLQYNQLKSLVAHEIIHVAHLHPVRAGKRFHPYFNIACDFVTNELLSQEDGFELIPGESLIDERFFGQSPEQVYEILMKENPPPEEPGDNEGDAEDDGNQEREDSGQSGRAGSDREDGGVPPDNENSESSGDPHHDPDAGDSSNGNGGGLDEESESSDPGSEGEPEGSQSGDRDPGDSGSDAGNSDRPDQSQPDAPSDSSGDGSSSGDSANSQADDGSVGPTGGESGQEGGQGGRGGQPSSGGRQGGDGAERFASLDPGNRPGGTPRDVKLDFAGLDVFTPVTDSEVEMQQLADQMQRMAFKAAQVAKAMGDDSKALSSVEPNAERKSSWQVNMRDFVTGILDKDDYTWARPNRRYVNQGVYLPSLGGTKKPRLMAIGVDVSGSISERQLEKFCTELSSILARHPKLEFVVYFCDTRIVKKRRYTIRDLPLKFRVYAGGGTDFTPPFKDIETSGEEVSGMIYFTDMYCSDYPTKPNYPVMWMNFGPPYETHIKHMYPAPFGEVVDMCNESEDIY